MQVGKAGEYQLNWNQLIEYLDADKDKRLGFDAFVTAATNRQRLINCNGNLKDAFDILDFDKDGLISMKELK